MAPSPASAHLLRGLLGGAEQLGCLCDVKLAGGQRYFRLSDQRVAAWLALKATAAKAALHASPSAAFRCASECVRGGGAWVFGGVPHCGVHSVIVRPALAGCHAEKSFHMC